MARGLAALVSMMLWLATSASASEVMRDPLPLFEFHSGLWLNLHEFLYASAQASLPPLAQGPALKITPVDTALFQQFSPEQQSVWRHAVEYYAAHYARRDLLFDDVMRAIKAELMAAEVSRDLKGAKIPPALKAVLLEAAPVYRQYGWPQHDRQNKRWISELQPLLQTQGVRLRQAMETIYATAWPTGPVRVEAAAYANWAGAYTTVDPAPQPVIATSDPANQGAAALEILFHETSHGMAGNLRTSIASATAQLPTHKSRALSMSLWHAVLFYTAGELVARGNPGYVTYAEQAGLWERAWPEPVHTLLVQDWQPHIEGKLTMDAALTQLVKDLTAAQ